MSYFFTEKEKEFILDNIPFDKINNVKKQIELLNGDEEKINDYYYDLLYDVEVNMLEDMGNNSKDYVQLSDYAFELENIYELFDILLINNQISHEDGLLVFEKADEIIEQLFEIEDDINREKEKLEKKNKKITKILGKMSN